MPATDPQNLRAETVPARVNLLFEADHARDEPPPSNTAMSAKIREHSGVSFPATLLEQVRAGDEGDVTAEQLTALARAVGLTTEYFGADEATARDIDSQLDLVRTMRDSPGHMCLRGGAPRTPAERDAIRDSIREIDAMVALEELDIEPDDEPDDADFSPATSGVVGPPVARQSGTRGVWRRLVARFRRR